MTEPDATGDALREQLTDLLRRTRPRVIFCLVDGEKRKMDTGGGRSVRYSQLARVIVAMGTALERVDLCNAKGELIESWHPKGAIVEDDSEEAAPSIAIPSGLGQLPAELVGQVLQLCVAFSQSNSANLQRAVDHNAAQTAAQQKTLLAGFVELHKVTTERLAYIERQQTQTFKLVQRSLEMQADSRSVALDAQRLAQQETSDPNSPDAIAASFARTWLDRQMGAGGAPSTPPAEGGRAYTDKRDNDEKH